MKRNGEKSEDLSVHYKDNFSVKDVKKSEWAEIKGLI